MTDSFTGVTADDKKLSIKSCVSIATSGGTIYGTWVIPDITITDNAATEWLNLSIDEAVITLRLTATKDGHKVSLGTVIVTVS